jgi:hypothetical protein
VTFRITASAGTRWGGSQVAGQGVPIFQRRPTASDFDGDGIADPAHFRASNGTWHVRLSTTGTERIHAFGLSGDLPVPGDYDGDGITDEAVFRYATGQWLVFQSSTQQATELPLGAAPDTDLVPIPSDYDGDGRTDAAVYDRSTAIWSMLTSSTNEVESYGFGVPDDPAIVPLPGDYDGDGITDPAIYYIGTGHWYIYFSSATEVVDLDFGLPGDFGVVPAPADYNGDGVTDPAFYYQQYGYWFLAILTVGEVYVLDLGIAGDPDVIPIPADYDGDGASDLGIYYKPNQNWAIFKSATQQVDIFAFGEANDVPVLNRVQALIGQLTPDAAEVGTTITIAGINFGSSQYGSVVRFNGIVATPTSWTNTTITVPVPVGATSGPVTVMLNNRASNARAFDVLAPPCQYTISPSEITVVATGGAGSVTVTATAGCTWTATSAEQWVTVGTGGTGDGAVSYTVASNETSTTARETTLTIAGKSFKVAQQAGILMPTISYTLSPAPNSMGWNNTFVTVSFTCAAGTYQVTFCTDPIPWFSDTSGTTVEGRAVDSAGNQAFVSAAIKIDRSPPVMTLFSPYEGEVFPLGTTTVTARGNVVDLRSGVGFVSCGGATGVLTGSTYSCSAAVAQGTQTIAIEATDLAGNVVTRQVAVSIGVTPPPTAIAITPAKMTMTVEERRQLDLTDQMGRPVLGWTVATANANVAEILVEDGLTFLHAVGAGQTTLTASLNGLTSESTVTVLPAGTVMADGTVLWALNPYPNSQQVRRGEVLRAMIGETATDSDPGLYFIDHDRLGASAFGPAYIRATTLDGRELWRYTTEEPIKHAAADNYGGLVVAIDANVLINSVSDKIRRIDKTGRVAWEYIQTVPRFGELSDVALHPDGRVFVVDVRDPISSNLLEYRTDLVELNGQTGAVLNRWELGWNPTPTHRQALAATSPIVLEDGSVAVVAHRVNGDVSRLVRFRLSGGVLTEHEVSGPVSEYVFEGHVVGHLMPDGLGGLIVAVDRWGTLFRVSSSDTLVGPLSIGIPDNEVDDIIQMALGENGGVALVQDWWEAGSWASAARMVFFDPTTMTTTQVEELSYSGVGITPRLLSNTLVGGGVAWTDMEGGFGAEVAPGFLAGWNIGEPGLEVQTSIAAATTVWAYSRGNAQAANTGPITYATADAAAIATLRQHVPTSNLVRREFGGSVCRTSATRYVGSVPAIGIINQVAPSPCAPGTTVVGKYHTHIENPPLDQPSGDDTFNRYNDGLIGYIGVAGDVTPGFSENCEPKKQGNIWKFVMDQAVPYNAGSPAYVFIDVIACTPIR